MKYEYKKVKGCDQKKFIENGHTMFEEDVLQRLKRLAYIEDRLKQANGADITHEECTLPVVSKSFNSLLDRLEKCFNADPQEVGNIFNRREAIDGWKDEELALEEFVKEKESELHVC